MRKFAITIVCAMAASGCAHNGQNFGLAPEGAQDSAPAFTNKSVTRSTDAMESALGALYTRASLFEEPKKGSEDWDKVILAGMDYVDDSCNEYLTSVYLAARNNQRAPSRSSSVARSFEEEPVNQAAFASPEATEKKLKEAKAKDQRDRRSLGLEAAFFHAANEDSREKFRAKTFSDRQMVKRREKFGALAALRGYLALCSPARVEAQLFQATAPKTRRRR